MARFPRTLGDALAAQAEAARNSRTTVMGVDALSPIGREQLTPGLNDDLDNLNADLATMDETMAGLGETLELFSSDVAGDLTALNTSMQAAQADLVTAGQELAAVDGKIDDKIVDAINDYNALPLTDDRFTESSLSVWPFMNGAIPHGAIAPGAIGESDIADFAIAVKKIKSTRHHIY